MSLSLSNLTFSYSPTGSSPTLRIKRWSLDTGNTVFVQGPSGSGKSTFLNILCGMLPATEGEVSLFGNRLDQMNSRQRDQFRANNIGYVFQQFNLIQYLDIIDNIKLAQQFSKKAASSNANEDIEHLLNSLNIDPQHWHKPARSLSIGQQQRVAIARAFINQPRLLIVDEPTSSLDHKNRDDFMSLLMKKVEDTKATLIFVSHDQTLSSHFSRVDSISEINDLASEKRLESEAQH